MKEQLIIILTLRRLAVTVAVRCISVRPLDVPVWRSCSRLVLVVGLEKMLASGSRKRCASVLLTMSIPMAAVLSGAGRGCSSWSPVTIAKSERLRGISVAKV